MNNKMLEDLKIIKEICDGNPICEGCAMYDVCEQCKIDPAQWEIPKEEK